MGEDGHTLSLFPGSSILDEKEKCVASVYSKEKKKTHNFNAFHCKQIFRN